MPEPTERPLGARIGVAVLLAVLGFALVVQIRGTGSDEYANLRQGELVELLKSVESASDRVDAQIEELTRTRDDLLSSTDRSARAEERARKRADDLAILAGTAPAVGPGVVVRIEDPEQALDATALLDAMSALRDGGAEAIAINSEIRVIASTAFTDAEDGVRADGVAIGSSIRLEAIGDPSTLASALEFPGALVDKVEAGEGTISINGSDRVEVTAVAAERAGQYAQPRSD